MPVETQDPTERLMSSVNRLPVAPLLTDDVFERAASRLSRSVLHNERPQAAPVTPVYKDFDEAPDWPQDRIVREFGRIAQARNKFVQMPPQEVVAGFNNILEEAFGLGGKERIKTWPERMAISAMTLPRDAWTGAEPMGQTGDRFSLHAIERAQEVAGLSGGAPLMARPGSATLGSGMTRPAPERYLVPAVKSDGKIYKGQLGSRHDDILVNVVEPGSEVKPNDLGFVNHKGQYLTREQAGEYAVNNNLIEPSNYSVARKGGLIADMLLSDTTKPALAIEALKGQKAKPFYSAVEAAVRDAPDAKMTPERWSGYLRNRPGVKAEELDWIGLPEGQKISKQEMLDHAKEHGVQMKEVRKSDKDIPGQILDDAAEQFFEDKGRSPESSRELVEYVQQRDEYMDSGDFGNHGPKFSEYQLPGGDNYREVLFTLPTKSQSPRLLAKKTYENTLGNGQWEDATAAQQQEWLNFTSLQKNNQDYLSSHWDEPNVLAHARMNDRIIPDVAGEYRLHGNGEYGKALKTLHLEEIQSDWHQAGRKQGYNVGDTSGWSIRKNDDGSRSVLNAKGEEVGPKTNHPTMSDVQLIKDYSKGNSGVPDAPFKTSWPDLVLKRMIREAAENGYDAVSWTPGEAQAARYDLSKHVDKVSYYPESQRLIAAKEGNVVLEKVVPPDQLAATIGKDPADKILNNPTNKIQVSEREPGKPHFVHQLEGLDLKVGGEGMKGFYDDMLVRKANALGKKYGAKVEWKEIPTHETIKDPLITDQLYDRAVEHLQQEFERRTVDKNWGRSERERRYEEFAESPEGERIFNDIIFKGEPVKMKVPVFRLTPQLRDVAMRKGFPLFSAGSPFPLIPVDHDPFAERK